MKIAVEMRQIVLGMGGGITLLLREVLEAAFRLYRDHEFLLLCTADNRGVIDASARNVRGVTLPVPSFFEELDRVVEAGGIDVVFRTYPLDVPARFPLERQVFLVPDLQHEVFPEFFTPAVARGRRSAFNLALARGGAIGTLSEFTRQTILACPWTRCRDVFLMPPALQTSHLVEAVAGAKGRLSPLIPCGEYFLYPANLWPHKNHRRLLLAFRRFLQRTSRRTSLVLTGDSRGWADIRKECADVPVIHLGFVADELIRALMERASALVFFSLYEGFGMPLLEAFDAGTPVICSDAGSLPEVGGDAVLTCDPTDVDAMSELMERVVTEPELRERLIRAGRRRPGFYSWETSARNLVEACERVARRWAAHDAGTARVAEDPEPLVSIVTPSFNQAQFLRRTIESVLAQSYPRIEYIVVDGGSSDGSVEILRSYGGRIFWTSERDRGQTEAINKGFARARGEILSYLNSDDLLLPGAVGTVVAHLRKHPECDLVYGRAQYIDESDRVTGQYPTDEYSFERLMQDCCICQPAAFWRARIARVVGGFDETLDCVMDYDYWLTIDRAGGRIQYIQDLLAQSRRYPETKTMSRRREVFREIFHVCQKHGGYVHLQYFLGLWHYLVHEWGDPRLAWVGLMPYGSFGAGWLHHKWVHRRRWKALARPLVKRAHALPGGRGAVALARALRQRLRWMGGRIT